MDDKAGPGLLRRKIAAARAMPGAGPTAEVAGADRAWPVALARAAQDGLRLDLSVTHLSRRAATLAELTEHLPERAFLALLDGPKGAIGLLAMAPPVLSALIEVQTMGRVLPHPTLPRRPTRTDAAMVADLIDRALAGLDLALAADPDRVLAAGFRYASFLDDPRPLGLILEDVPYALLTADVTLGGGVKSGAILLVLPADGQGERPATSGREAAPDPGLAFARDLATATASAAVVLDATLGRLSLPLEAVLNLQPGAVLPLLGTNLAEVRLEGARGEQAATGRLGQARGFRALRLSGIDAAALAEPATLSAQAGPAVLQPTG